MAAISGNYSINNAADDKETLGQLINIRCGLDAPVMNRLLLGSNNISLTGADVDSKTLLSSGVIDTSNSLNQKTYLMMKQKYAGVTQVAAQFHASAPQKEANR